MPWCVWKSEGMSGIVLAFSLIEASSLQLFPLPLLLPLMLHWPLSFWVILLSLSPTLPQESQNHGCYPICLFEWVPAIELRCQACVAGAPLPAEPSPWPRKSLELTAAVLNLQKTCHKIRPVHIVMEDTWTHRVLPLLRTYNQGRQGPTLPIYKQVNDF